jgi:hypothetical protein
MFQVRRLLRQRRLKEEFMKTKQQTVADLATSMLQPLSAVADAAHELRNRIAPDVVPVGRHGHRIAEARSALAIATADLATTTAKFHRVYELLRAIED